MGKKSKRKGKPDRKPKDYEGFQYGPFRVERHGRYVAMSTHWKPGEYEKHIENIKSKRPELKDNINTKIQELLTIIEQNDPFELLSTISYKNCLTDPEQYRESTYEGRECYVEYALSIISAHNKHGFDRHADEATIERFNQLISEILNHVMWYYITEAVEKKRDLVEEELRFQSIMRYMFIRGDSFSEHHIDLMKDIFKPHDGFLKKHYGLTTDEIISGIEEIEHQVVKKANDLISGLVNVKKCQGLFEKFVDEKGVENFQSIEECFKAFRCLPEVQEKQQEFEGLKEVLEGILFEIKPKGAATEAVIELLSTQLGENRDFITCEKAQGWPTNDSMIYRRPLIRHDGKI
jgi:hypothetical protein